jgi:ribosome-binding ATPase YchF (GTP1/OBG family)
LKIGFLEIELEEGKVKFNDQNLNALEKKDRPKKVTPFFAEFVKDQSELHEELAQVDAIIIPTDNILDLLIVDIEKVEIRLERAENDAEKKLLQTALDKLESEIPLCDAGFNPEEEVIILSAAPFSLKPVIQITGDENSEELIAKVLEKAGFMFFYTTGPSESHAWLVKKGSDIITCAAKIHSDLARGFIKGDVVAFDDYLECHSFNECKTKGVARVVDRDYIVQPNEIIEIRFNV